MSGAEPSGADPTDPADPVDPIVARLKELLVTRLEVRLAPELIRPETPLFDGGLALDSFAIVELISLVEASFDFQFSENDLRPETFANLRTLAGRILAAPGS